MPKMQKIYHVDGGEPVEMYGVDARQALRSHPKEWSAQPWGDKAARRTDAEPPREPQDREPQRATEPRRPDDQRDPSGAPDAKAPATRAATEPAPPQPAGANRTTPADYDIHRDEQGNVVLPDDLDAWLAEAPHFSKVALANEITGNNDRKLKSADAERIIREYQATQRPPE